MKGKRLFEKSSNLYFVGGTAEGETELTAFDSALQESGIHEANILEVSSVIPRGAEIHEDARERVEKVIEAGGFYPVVLSKKTSSSTGEEIYAAVAGCKFSSGYGVNVEVHGSEASREKVKERCRMMLEDMAERRGEKISGDMYFEYNSCTVEDTCCAISAVVYTS